jgi:hypothetical protein
MVQTELIPTPIPNVSKDQDGYLYVFGELTGITEEQLRGFTEGQIADFRRVAGPCSYIGQLMQYYLDSGSTRS